MSRARRIRRGLLSVTWVPGSVPPPQVAYAINRKVGGAVVRNRLRRRFRELARCSDLAPGAWLISAAPGAGEADFATLRGWLEDALSATAGGSR